MTIRRYFVHELTILRPGGPLEDRYGDEVPDWDNPTSRSVRGWLAQISSDEDNAHRDATITRATAVLPADDPIAEGDRVVDELLGRTRTWDVIGVPNVGRTPRGTHHVEAALRAVEG